MHEYAFYDTVLLGDFRHLHETLVRIVVIFLEHRFHPARGHIGCVILDFILHETFDFYSAYGHVDETHPVSFRIVGEHRPAEIVGRSHTVAVTAERRKGLVPLPHLSASVLVIDGSEGKEAVAHTHGVNALGTGCAFHI